MPNPIKVYWHAPSPIFAARVNLPSATYPIQNITYNTVTTGAYTDLSADMFFTLGSAAGLDDYGRGRLRQAPTSTTLKVGRASQGFEDGQLNVVDAAYITVYEDFRVFSKIPVIKRGEGDDYSEYKDADIPVDYRTEEPVPVCNMGTDFAGSIDPITGTLTVFFAGSASYAVADLATITGYAWDAGGGMFVNGTTATDDDVYIEFEPGVYWVHLTVTDSSGHTNTGHRFVLADDPADSLCVSGMQVTNITRTQQGSSARLRVLQELPRADYPDGAKVLIWEDRPSLDGVSRDHVLFTGWHQTDQASSRAMETHLQRETELVCVDVAGRLDSLPGFHQRLEVPDEVAGLTWGEMPAANMDKFLCYLIQWHSTAAQIADFYTSGTWDDYPFVIFDSGGATLYEQLQRQANRIVPDHNFTCDRYGTLRVVVDPMLQDSADRTIVIQNSLTDQSWSEIDFGYQRPPRVHTLHGSALLTQTAWVIDEDDEKQLLTPVFAIAPGTAPGQGGREQTIGERLTQSQEDLNAVTGHHYARLNARYSPIRVTLNSNADPWDFDPAAHTWVNLIVATTSAPHRGLDFANVRCLCQEVSIDYNYGETGMTWRGRVVLERETEGLPALTPPPQVALPVGEQPVTPVPSYDFPTFGLESGANQVAGIGSMGEVCRTSDFQSATPTWDVVYFTHSELVDPELLQCFVVDPFSPGYNGVVGGAINGWAVNQDGIWRLTDLFGATPGAELAHSFATTDAMYQGTYAIAASFGAFFEAGNPWIVVTAAVNRAGATADADDGVWAIHSEDAGATWSTPVRVSPIAASGTTYETRQRPTVWTSPRTPGYAITFAYTTLTEVEGYYTDDWGDTWYRLSDEDPADPDLPMFISFDGVANTTLRTEIGSHFADEISVVSSTSTLVNAERSILMAPPADATRVLLSCSVVHQRTQDPLGSTATSQSFTLQKPATINESETLTFSAAAANDPAVVHDFTVEWTRASGTEWPGNREATVTPPSGSDDANYVRLRMIVSAVGATPGTATNYLATTVTVDEIEFEDLSVWSPSPGSRLYAGQGLGGGIHIPWPDNADEEVIYYGRLIPGTPDLFTLHRVVAGVETDITPTDATGGYGPYRGLFGIRTHDNNRQKLLFAGKTEGADGFYYYSIFASADAGTTWTQVQGPDVESEFGNYGGWEAAFAADDLDTIFVWGGSQRDAADGATSYGTVIGYSDDFGATIQDKTGNLITLEASDENLAGFIGIAGGPNA